MAPFWVIPGATKLDGLTTTWPEFLRIITLSSDFVCGAIDATIVCLIISLIPSLRRRWVFALVTFIAVYLRFVITAAFYGSSETAWRLNELPVAIAISLVAFIFAPLGKHTSEKVGDSLVS